VDLIVGLSEDRRVGNDEFLTEDQVSVFGKTVGFEDPFESRVEETGNAVESISRPYGVRLVLCEGGSREKKG
jgi:hypothetical protein